MTDLRMPYDDASWEDSERIADSWLQKFNDRATMAAVGNFITKHRGGTPVELFPAQMGGFNVSFRMEFLDGGSALIRFPIPGFSMFPEEKVRREVAVMRYLQENTAIPVPFVLHWGSREESPENIGPFILMEYIKHDFDMVDALNTPGLGPQDRPILDPNIEESKLEMLYRQVADILLQLHELSLPAIGSLVDSDDLTWEVKARPVSLGMNELVRLGSLPRKELPTTTFGTSSAYMNHLADLYFSHLEHQRNDAVEDENDCRRRYTARCLFQDLARKHRLTQSSTDRGPFKLWCDDFRPANILLNSNLEIVGVVDWEFTYAAPADYAFSPPLWLLLEQPEKWERGLNDWLRHYDRRLQTFLKVLRECEDARIERSVMKEEKLSKLMHESWESGQFWVMYAARNSFAFDAIFWATLDAQFFGNCEAPIEDTWKSRVALLSESQKEDMDEFVKRKLAEKDNRALRWEPEESSDFQMLN